MDSEEQKTKVCGTCGKRKPLSEFSKRNDVPGGKYRSYCRSCDREYSRKHYRDHKKYYKEKAKRHREQVRAKVWQYKCEHACERCGETHPACLIFHHQNADGKERDISKMVTRRAGWPAVLREIQKCEALCANCHRKLHYDERTLREDGLIGQDE